MKKWRLIIEQVEAGFAAYRWIWEHIDAPRVPVVYSMGFFSTVGEAEADAREHEPT